MFGTVAQSTGNTTGGGLSSLRSWESQFVSQIGSNPRPGDKVAEPTVPPSDPNIPDHGLDAGPVPPPMNDAGPVPPSMNDAVLAPIPESLSELSGALQPPRPRPRLRAPEPPTATIPSISQSGMPTTMQSCVKIHTASSNGPDNSSAAVSNATIDVDLQLDIAQLSIDPGPRLSMGSRSDASSAVSKSGCRAKSKAGSAVAAFPVQQIGSNDIPAAPVIPHAVLPTVNAGRTTRSRKKAT